MPTGDPTWRVVVDPNVLIAALISAHGPPAQLLNAVRSGSAVLVASPTLFTELGAVLRREKFRRYVTTGVVSEYMTALAGLAELVVDPLPTQVQKVCRDPDDDYLVALARVAGVDALVSGDRDLLDLSLPGLVIISPRRAVEVLGTTPDA
jgi:putative PIN family toxin of toxin-antitoxin system